MTEPTHSDAKPGPQLRYSEDGRGGTIHYTSPETRFDMWYEFAMPPALVIIGIPESKYWEGQTKTPLAQREAILQFIGEQVIQDKLAGSGHFLLSDQILTVLVGK